MAPTRRRNSASRSSDGDGSEECEIQGRGADPDIPERRRRRQQPVQRRPPAFGRRALVRHPRTPAGSEVVPRLPIPGDGRVRRVLGRRQSRRRYQAGAGVRGKGQHEAVHPHHAAGPVVGDRERHVQDHQDAAPSQGGPQPDHAGRSLRCRCLLTLSALGFIGWHETRQ